MTRAAINQYPNSLFFKDTLSFPLRVWREEAQVNVKLHSHEFWECVFILSGSGLHQSGGNAPVAIGPGDVIVIPVGGTHSISPVNNLSLINLLFDSRRLPSLPLELYSQAVYQALFIRDGEWYAGKNFPHIHVEKPKFAEMKEYLRRMAEAGSSPKRHCYCLGLFMALISMICNALEEVDTAQKYIPLDIVKLSAFLEANYSRKISIQELAALTNMSRSTLMRHFRNTFGVSPIGYVQRIRMQNAARMLTNTNSPLKEIAAATGFPSDSYFFRAFKKAYGVSPNCFRKNKTSYSWDV